MTELFACMHDQLYQVSYNLAVNHLHVYHVVHKFNVENFDKIVKILLFKILH